MVKIQKISEIEPRLGLALTSIFTLENHRKAGVGKSPSQSFLFI